MNILLFILYVIPVIASAAPDPKVTAKPTTTDKCDVDASSKIFTRCSRLVENYVVALRLHTLPQLNENEVDLEKRFRNVIHLFCGFVNTINTCTLLLRQLCEISPVDDFVRNFDEQSKSLRQASDSFCQAHNYARVNFGCLAGIQPTIDAQCNRKLRRPKRQASSAKSTTSTNEVDPECATSIEYFLECNRYVARTLCGKASGDARASLVMLSVLKLIHPNQNPCASEKDSDGLGGDGGIHDSAEDDGEGDMAILAAEAESDMEWMDLGEESFYMPKQHDTIYITRMVPAFGKDDPIAQQFEKEPVKEKDSLATLSKATTTNSLNANWTTKNPSTVDEEEEDEETNEEEEETDEDEPRLGPTVKGKIDVIAKQTAPFDYAEEEEPEQDELMPGGTSLPLQTSTTTIPDQTTNETTFTTLSTLEAIDQTVVVSLAENKPPPIRKKPQKSSTEIPAIILNNESNNETEPLFYLTNYSEPITYQQSMLCLMIIVLYF